MVEPTVTIRVRQADKGLVEGVLGKASSDYKAKIKKDVQLKVDPENYLPADTCGGIDLIANKGRIKVCYQWPTLVLIGDVFVLWAKNDNNMLVVYKLFHGNRSDRSTIVWCES